MKQQDNRKIHEGMILWMEKVNRSSPKEIVPVKVSKVGRKYFYIDDNDVRKFNVSTLKHDSIYSLSEKQLYLTKEEIEERWERDKLISNIRGYFSWHNIDNTLQELREAARILKIRI